MNPKTPKETATATGRPVHQELLQQVRDIATAKCKCGATAVSLRRHEGVATPLCGRCSSRRRPYGRNISTLAEWTRRVTR